MFTIGRWDTLIRWLQKSLIVAVALLTFGVITPAHEIWSSFQDKSDSKHAEGSFELSDYELSYTEPQLDNVPKSMEELLITSARDLSYQKFGTKIGPVIANEFDDIIFPKIDEFGFT